MAPDMLSRKTLYMIAGIQRTGTGYLVSLLRSRPDLHCYGEPLAPGANFERRPAEAMDMSLHQWLDAAFASRPEPVTGLKFMQDYTAPYIGRLLDYIRVRGVHLVRVARRNTLKTFVSRLRTEREKVWHTNEPVAFRPMEIPTQSLVTALSRITMEDAKLDKALEGMHVLRVVYEDLCADPAAAMDAVQDHLGLDRLELTSAMRKLVPDDLRLALSNFDAVRRALEGTRFLRCLE